MKVQSIVSGGVVGCVLLAAVVAPMPVSAGGDGPGVGTEAPGQRLPAPAPGPWVAGPAERPAERWPGAPLTTAPAAEADPVAEVANDRDFDPGMLLGDQIEAVALQDDGRIIIAGEFGSVDGANRPNLARLEADGSVDRSFRNANVSKVNDVAVLDDGRVLVAGGFTTVGGGTRFAFARLSADGTLDTTLPDADIRGPVNSIAVAGDGSIVVGGDFATVSGVERHGVARLHPDGTLDTTFGDPGFDVSPIGTDGVREVAIDGQGRVLVVGDFVTVDGVARASIVRLLDDGSVDPSFTAPTIAADDGLQDVALQPDGRIVISGDLTAVAGSARTDVARLHDTGTLDTTFADPHVAGTASVADVAIQADGRLVIVGDFLAVGGQARRGAARLLANGVLDTSLANPVLDGPVLTVAVQPDGKLVVGGTFDFVEGRYSPLIARLHAVSLPPIGVLDPSFGGDGIVQSALTPSQFAVDVAIQSDGRIVSSGSASRQGGSVIGVMRHESDGDLDPTFGGGDGGVETNVAAGDDWAEGIALQPDGRIVVAGHAGTGPRAGFAVVRYLADGTPDPTFSGDGRVTVDFGSGTEVAFDLQIQADGRIVVAGLVGGRGGQFGLARLRRNGTLDPTFGTGGRVVTDFTAGQDWVNAVALRPDGRIVAVGGSVDSTAKVALARYRTDGSLDTAFGSRGRLRATFGGPSAATAVALQPDGRLVVVGVADDKGIGWGIARFLASGARDLSFASNGNAILDITRGDDAAYDVVVEGDGDLVAVGEVATGGGAFAMARLRPDGRIDTDFGVNGVVTRDLTAGPDVAFAAAAQSDGKLVLAGGSGTSVGQVTLARYSN